MLSAAISALGLPTLLKFIVTAFVVGVAAIHLVKNTASKYFVAGKFGDEGEANRRIEEAGRMAVNTADDRCSVCRKPTTTKCSRCKAVRYCSSQCQSQDWARHKTICKLAGVQKEVETITTFGFKNPTKRMQEMCQVSPSLPPRAICNIKRQPRKVLFLYDEFVELFNWKEPGLIPCGLLNCGNSCFANVVLQCLAATRPLTAFLLRRNHSKECCRNDWCFLCEFETHVNRVRRSLQPFSPINILSHIPNIGSNLGYGKQEDAHEFMRFAIDTMQSVCLDEFGGEKSLEPSSRETTLIHHIFGGHLQSQVICSQCGKISNQYDNMMDLTVEIQGDAESLEECLNQFSSEERLDGDNMYKCDGCNAYVMALKRLTVHQAPNILTIALKRFQSGRFGKLNKRVLFSETLDLDPYMSDASDTANVYKLYCVVVHLDMLNASFFGHYICYTKDNQGNWFRIDDCKVMKVELEEVLSQRAYMLLYSRVDVRPASVKYLEQLQQDNLSVGTKDTQSAGTDSRSMNMVLHVPRDGSLCKSEHATQTDHSVDTLLPHARPNCMGIYGSETSENSSGVIPCEEFCSRSKEVYSGDDGNHDSQKENCMARDCKWDPMEHSSNRSFVNEISSRIDNAVSGNHGQFHHEDSSSNGFPNTLPPQPESSEKFEAVECSNSLISTIEEQKSVTSVQNTKDILNVNRRICSDEIRDDQMLQSPRESLCRSFRRPKPIFAPGFLDRNKKKPSSDEIARQRSSHERLQQPDQVAHRKPSDGGNLISASSLRANTLCNGIAHSFADQEGGDIGNGGWKELDCYRDGSSLLANCKRPKQETC